MEQLPSRRYLGLDIGKTKLAVALVDETGGVLGRSRTATPLDEGGPAIIDRCRTLLRDALADADRIDGIGIGASGVIDHATGVIRSSGSIPNWTDIPVKRDFEREFGVPVFVDNDVSAAALAEASLGAGRVSRSSAFLTISTGVGFGAVFDGHIWHGAHGLSGQIAHMIGIGDERSMNELFSGAGIAAAGAEALGARLSTAEVFSAADDGAQPAVRVVAGAAEAAGSVVAWIQTSLDPELIILGGSVAVANPGFRAAIARSAASKLAAYGTQLAGGPRIALAQLGDDASVVGSAWLVRQADAVAG